MNILQRIETLKALLEQDWLTMKEAQIYADRSEATLYRLIRQDKLVTKKNQSGRTFVKRASIDTWNGGNNTNEEA